MTEKPTAKTIDEQIDANLKRVYQASAQEPLPDKFLSLLEQLKAKEKGGSA
jgi:hypothetical protein